GRRLAPVHGKETLYVSLNTSSALDLLHSAAPYPTADRAERLAPGARAGAHHTGDRPDPPHDARRRAAGSRDGPVAAERAFNRGRKTALDLRRAPRADLAGHAGAGRRRAGDQRRRGERGLRWPWRDVRFLLGDLSAQFDRRPGAAA